MSSNLFYDQENHTEERDVGKKRDVHTKASISFLESKPFIVEDRMMISRVACNKIKITHTIEPGRRLNGAMTCCHAPDSCTVFGLLPCCFCCDYPSYIVNQVNASKYIYIRENSIEWNNPSIRLAPTPYKYNKTNTDTTTTSTTSTTTGGCIQKLKALFSCVFCCGLSCSDLTVSDDVSIIYFDDPYFSEIRNKTRMCNDFRTTCCCGGNGEQIEILDTFGIYGSCKRNPGPVGACCHCCCVPTCFPNLCSKQRNELYVEDAEIATTIILRARDDARRRLQITRMER